jgi:hypothetical protein
MLVGVTSLTFLLLFPHSSYALAALGDAVIEKRAGDSTIQLTTSAQFGGSVSSLVFRGVQYVDTRDHGRELQSASSFDGLGECFNPTEAGSVADRNLPTTSSKVIALKSGGDWIATQTDMTFWLPPGYDYKHQCGSTPSVTHAVNRGILGGHILDKRIEIGKAGERNVIADHVTYTVPEVHASGTFEAATLYTPVAFSKRYVLNLDTGDLEPTTTFGEQSRPVILATEDGKSAIGVFSSALPQNNLGYGTFSFSNTQKINCVFREKAISAGQKFSYECDFVVGTLKEVKNSIVELHQHAGTGASE